MARYKFQSHLRDGNGKVISEGTVLVYDAGTTDFATIYTVSSGGTSTDRVETSSTGFFYFWLDSGNYSSGDRVKLVCSKYGFSSQTYDEVFVF